MPTLRIPTPLRPYAGNQGEVSVKGSTVAEALESLTTQYPALTPHLFNEEGSLRPFVTLFLNDENIQDLQGTQTILRETDRLMLIPSIAGGTNAVKPRRLEDASKSIQR